MLLLHRFQSIIVGFQAHVTTTVVYFNSCIGLGAYILLCIISKHFHLR